MLEKRALADVMTDLLAARVALRPPWFQPGPPMEAWLVPEGTGALLVVWDPTRERAERAVAYDEARLRADLPRLVTSGVVWARDIVASDAVPSAVAACGRALLTRLDAALRALRADPTLSLAQPLGPEAIDHVSWSAAVGWRSFLVSKGAPIRVGRIDEDNLASIVSAMLFRGDELAPQPIDADVRARLDEGERRWVALHERMVRGEIGWRVHVDRVVVDVDGDLFNASFHGTQVTYSHAFVRGHVDADMLSRTLTEAEPSAIVPLLPGQQAALRASVRPK